jgi:hypothetical protein
MGAVLEGEVDVGGAGESHIEGGVDLLEPVAEPLGDEEGEVLFGNLGDADVLFRSHRRRVRGR